MPRPKKEESNAGEQNFPAAYTTKVRIMKSDKSIIEKGAEVTPSSDKLEDWINRGLIEKK